MKKHHSGSALEIRSREKSIRPTWEEKKKKRRKREERGEREEGTVTLYFPGAYARIRARRHKLLPRSTIQFGECYRCGEPRGLIYTEV